MAEDQTIRLSYRLTVDELMMARSMHEKLTLKRKPGAALARKSWIKALICLSGVAALSRLVLDVIQGNPFSGLHVLTVLLALLLVGYFALPWIGRRSLRRHFEKRPDRNRIVRYAIDAHRVVSSVEGLSEGSSEWSSFAEVVRTPQGFLFYPNDMLFHWLPNHAFASPEDTDALADMARQHAPKYQDLGE